MHTKKMTKSDWMVVLILIGIFAIGFTLGSMFESILNAVTPDHTPQTAQALVAEVEPEPEAVEVQALTNCEASATQPEPLGEFKLTAYCICTKCCGEWADGVTATGVKATAGRTIAVDPDVIPLGSTVIINGAEYIAEDIGGAIKGKRVDVLLPSHEEALQFGVQYANISIIKN